MERGGPTFLECGGPGGVKIRAGTTMDGDAVPNWWTKSSGVYRSYLTSYFDCCEPINRSFLSISGGGLHETVPVELQGSDQ